MYMGINNIQQHCSIVFAWLVLQILFNTCFLILYKTRHLTGLARNDSLNNTFFEKSYIDTENAHAKQKVE